LISSLGSEKMNIIDIPEKIAPNLRKRLIMLVVPEASCGFSSSCRVWIASIVFDDLVHIYADKFYLPICVKHIDKEEFDSILDEDDVYIAEFFLCRMNKK